MEHFKICERMEKLYKLILSLNFPVQILHSDYNLSANPRNAKIFAAIIHIDSFLGLPPYPQEFSI